MGHNDETALEEKKEKMERIQGLEDGEEEEKMDEAESYRKDMTDEEHKQWCRAKT